LQQRSLTIGGKSGKIMKQVTPRIWPLLTAVSISATIFFSVTHWLLASPSEEITAAVAADGTNPQQASPDQFIQAFSAVLAGADQKQSAAYTDAATKLRPDLKDRIGVAAKEGASSPAGDTATNNATNHQRKCFVCCDHVTIKLPCRLVNQYLHTHPGCVRGKCHY